METTANTNEQVQASQPEANPSDIRSAEQEARATPEPNPGNGIKGATKAPAALPTTAQINLNPQRQRGKELLHRLRTQIYAADPHVLDGEPLEKPIHQNQYLAVHKAVLQAVQEGLGIISINRGKLVISFDLDPEQESDYPEPGHTVAEEHQSLQ
jgi:hypothetical protein